MRFASSLALACAALLSADAGVARPSGSVKLLFPASGWQGATLVEHAHHNEIVDANGMRILKILDKRVAVTFHDDHVTLDPRPAFRGGSHGVVFDSDSFDPGAFAGRDVVVRSVFRGTPVTRMRSYLEGRTEDDRHYYTSRIFHAGRAKRSFDLVRTVPTDLRELHLRWDFLMNTPAPVDFYGAEMGTFDVLPPYEPETGKPEVLFYANFDGTAEATDAKGEKRPLSAKGLSFGEGIRGRALRVANGRDFRLEYALKGNVRPTRGTIAMWIRRDWPDTGVTADGKEKWRTLFSMRPFCRDLGSGCVSFWWWCDALRGDQRDMGDENVSWKVPYTNAWQHVAMTWHENGIRIYVDGRGREGLADSSSVLGAALDTADALVFQRRDFTSFAIGGEGDRTFEGLIDELTVYSEPLSEDGIRALYRRVAPPAPKPDWERCFASRPNAFLKDGTDGLSLEPVEEIRLPADRGKLKRFKVIGDTANGLCDRTPYLELGPREGDRLAIGFEVDTKAPLYVIDLDYPDDKVRTADVIVQTAKPHLDYALQVGYAAGGENANTGRILTHRMLYWTQQTNASLVVMTARKDAPAAVSAVRIYKVRDGRLPAARINEPPDAGGWHRTVALYYEDPAIGYDFATRTGGSSCEDLARTIDATVAYMKYVGENMLIYPGAWYQGLIDHDAYNPRNHPADVRRAWYVRFDQEGLYYMPTLNPNNKPVGEGLVTRSRFYDGSLHASEISILDTGRPNPGGWHGTPPNFSIANPETQAYLEGLVDTLLAEGRDHPSFKGICLHVTKHNMLTFGCPEAGYNDYAVEAFERSAGLRIPVDRTDPLRGKAYADWIRANAYGKWTDWRCRVVADFWCRMADKLAAARTDLKLMINASAIPVDAAFDKVDPSDPNFMDAVYREASFDARLFARATNLILCRTLVPADGRFKNWRLPEEKRLFEETRLDLKGNYSLWAGAAFPWLNHHDRYWESPIGRLGTETLTSPWMREQTWRVSTINPSGLHAMRDIIRPLRFYDVLGFSKGGFLIGTYGMEEPFRKFAQAFRALPAVPFKTLRMDHPYVRVRGRTVAGIRYLYLVNTGYESVERAFRLPVGAVNLVTGRAEAGDVRLGPYELRSYRIK